MATKWKLNMMSIALFDLSHMSLFYSQNKLGDHDGSRTITTTHMSMLTTTNRIHITNGIHVEFKRTLKIIRGECFDPGLNHIDLDSNRIPKTYKFGIIELRCCNYCHLQSDSFIQNSITHDNISSQVADKRRVGFWPMDELIHHP